jgi:hypothetical protein
MPVIMACEVGEQNALAILLLSVFLLVSRFVACGCFQRLQVGVLLLHMHAGDQPRLISITNSPDKPVIVCVSSLVRNSVAN